MPKYPYRSLGSWFDRLFRNNLNDNFKDIESDIKEKESESISRDDYIQQQLNQMSKEGDSSVEAAQARVDLEGNAYDTLKDRIDAEQLKIGDLLSLTTTEKRSLTGAVNEVNTQLASTEKLVKNIRIDITKYGAKGDGLTDDTQAIKDAIADAPIGAELYFPPATSAYYIKAPTDPLVTEIFVIDKPLKIKGSSIRGALSLDVAIPQTCDIFVINPKETGDLYFTGYGCDNLCVAPKLGRPARHVINIKTIEAGKKVAYSSFTNNQFYETTGYSLHLENPTNSDALFAVQITGNLFRSGMKLDRAGDSINVLGNVFAGYNDVYVSLVAGSNAFMFAFNNVTCRGGLIFKRGFNSRFVFNNFECGYADSSYVNNAVIDLDGSDHAAEETYGMLNIEFSSNNISFRSTAPTGIDAIRINKARGTVIENNHIAKKGANHINITSLAQLTEIGYNQFPSSDGTAYVSQGTILDNGINTIRRNTWTVAEDPNDLYDIWQHDAEKVRFKGDRLIQRFGIFDYEAKDAVQATHQYTYKHDNASTIKTILQTRQKNADNTYSNTKDIAYITSDAFMFPSQGFRVRNSSGSNNLILYASAMPTTGTYTQGDEVVNTKPAIQGTSPNRYVVEKWIRLTTGSNHVLGVDWWEDKSRE